MHRAQLGQLQAALRTTLAHIRELKVGGVGGGTVVVQGLMQEHGAPGLEDSALSGLLHLVPARHHSPSPHQPFFDLRHHIAHSSLQAQAGRPQDLPGRPKARREGAEPPAGGQVRRSSPPPPRSGGSTPATSLGTDTPTFLERFQGTASSSGTSTPSLLLSSSAHSSPEHLGRR